MKIDIRLPFITIIKTDHLADMRRDIDKARREIEKNMTRLKGIYNFGVVFLGDSLNRNVYIAEKSW